MRQQLLAMVLAATLGIATATAQSYPTRPIRLVIPYPPGGVVDTVGRPWADSMKSLLGTIVVDNISGGGGEIGAATVARARPDGYMILLANSSIMVINPLATSHITYVPYRGAGPAIADLIAGQIPMAIPAVNGQLLAFHRAGKLRILAVTSAVRLQGAPDLPTVSEAGVPQLIVQATTWLLVPKGTPRDVIEQISSATRKALAEPELRQVYLSSGIEPPSDSSPEAATRLLQDEIVRWKPVVKRIGLKLD